MPKSYINRELSWLEFNQRVICEAACSELPLLERVKFLAISAANLDEFFQVRVGGLSLMQSIKSRRKDASGMTATQQLKAIRSRVKNMLHQQYALLNNELLPKLATHDILFSSPQHLPQALRQELLSRFTNYYLPLLTPLAYEEGDDNFGHSLPAMTLIFACCLRDVKKKQRLCFIPIPDIVGRFILLNEKDKQHIILIEDLIALFAHKIFPEEELISRTDFRITRNGDIAVQEEDAIDLAGEMEEVLTERKTSNIVRLELRLGAPKKLTSQIKLLTNAGNDLIYKVAGPIGLGDLMNIATLSGYDSLKAAQWLPQTSPHFDKHTPIFETLSNRDVLLYHPYQSFEPVIRFLEEAAIDPNVLSIKQVLYRTAKQSRILAALILAAQNGKQVTVLVELKARFDEARNLHRAQQLQRAGVQVVYGVKGLKTHAKLALVIRKEAGGLKRYTHFGTGNYNETTAKVYTDASLFTSHDDFGADASAFFNAMTGRSKLVNFRQLEPAPTHMKKRLLELIASETQRVKLGEIASITAKVNSLQDADIINALYKASRAGVTVQLNVRGICCLSPDNSKNAKNIRIISIIDHYLEHSRIFHFHQGGDDLVYISSADWMSRNLEKRLELMIPILDPDAKKQLIHILHAAFRDNQQAYEIQADGTSLRIKDAHTPSFRMQHSLQEGAERLAKAISHRRATTFEPHLPSGPPST